MYYSLFNTPLVDCLFSSTMFALDVPVDVLGVGSYHYIFRLCR